MAETWQDLGGSTDPSRAGDLLERLAFLAPDPVPESLLDVPVPGGHGGGRRVRRWTIWPTYSLVTRDPESGTFLLHRLVQDVTRRGLAEAGTERQRADRGAGLGGRGVRRRSAGDVRTWTVLEPLAPHAEAVAGHADAAASPSRRCI